MNGNKHARSIAVVQFSSASAFLRPPRGAMGAGEAQKGCVLAIQGKFLASRWLVVLDGADLKSISGEGPARCSPAAGRIPRGILPTNGEELSTDARHRSDGGRSFGWRRGESDD